MLGRVRDELGKKLLPCNFGKRIHSSNFSRDLLRYILKKVEHVSKTTEII